MASPFSKHQWIHDVFINFRGEDTRSNFVSHLYAALSSAGINTFFDDKNLQKGTELKPELLRAIEGSQIAIVVFSEKYTESSWCLDELEQIWKCHKSHGQLILPIFYYVDPSVVRQQKGDFGDALTLTAKKRFSDLLARWEQVANLPEFEVWMSVLTLAANISGWDVNNGSNESIVVKEIVAQVMKKLDKKSLPIPDFPVGLQSRAEHLIRFSRKNTRGVCLVGIWGMGGIGKSTIAKVIYNNLCNDFEDQSFLANIREVWEKDKGQIDLQEQLLSDILTRKIKVHSVEWGKTMIKERLCTKRALVVLDDVSNSKQLNLLCGNRNEIGPGSIIIITTRDKRLLDTFGVDFVYEAEGLNAHESLMLFSWHAFREVSPTEGFLILSRDVVGYCEGLPLALEVLGSYLFMRSKEEWHSVLSKLKIIPNGQIHEKLKISFDGLSDRMEKDIFLDVCCFFIGKDKAYVTEILNGCGLHAGIGIPVLIEKSLIKVEKNNMLGMHALLRDMGREIVRESSPDEPEKRSRLWCHEDVVDVLTDHTGTKAIEGLVMKLQTTTRVCFSTTAFEKMKRLRLLQLDHVQLIGDYECFPKHLRWLSWQGFPLKYTPENFYQENLVAMDLKRSNLKQVWKKPQLLQNLKFLNLSHSKYLKSTPDFSKLPNLENLIMKDCQSLSEVHSSIGDLKNLILINMKDCKSLCNLPREMYQLTSVKTLILSGSNIEKLEEDIGQMKSLTTLIATNTKVKQVPFSIVILKSIGYISLCGYEGSPHDVFPSLIRSWMTPTMNYLEHIPSFGGMSMSLVSLDIESKNLGLAYQSPILSSCSKLRTFWVQCESEIQLKQELKRFLDDLYDVNFAELETTTGTSKISDLSLRSLLIGVGSCHTVIDTLGNNISQGLATSSSDYLLPGSNYPFWLAYTSEGPSVLFQVPENNDRSMKGMTLCVLYSSTPENMATECFTTVLIINYTKLTIQIYKRDTIMSFNDEDWQGVVSNLGVGDNVEIFVAIGRGLTVKEMAVYLIYDQPNAMEIEPSISEEVKSSRPSGAEMDPSITIIVEPSRPSDTRMESLRVVKVQPSPNVKTEPLPEAEVQPSRDVKTEPSFIVKNEPLPKKNRKIFRRLAKRVGECLCLNQN